MGWIAERSPQPWRNSLVPASFRGVQFHVEAGAKASGRRIALHEYPKRDIPYAEDMGRRTRRFQIAGYLVSPNYLNQRRALEDALEREGAGTLQMPTGPQMQVICENYSWTETRERGGYVVFEMTFVEVGEIGIPVPNTRASVGIAAGAAGSAAGKAFATTMGTFNQGIRV